MLRSLLCVGALVCLSAAAQAVSIVFTFEGTVVNETPFAGYTPGQTVVVTYTLSDPLSTVISDSGPSFYYWDDSFLDDPAAYLFSGMTTTGLTGVWTNTPDVGNFITINEGPLPVFALNTYVNGAVDIGYLADGIGVTSILMQGTVNAPFIFGPTPVSLEYFANYAGTYNLTSLGLGSMSSIMVEGDRHINLDITTMTIAVIPEPSAVLAFLSGSVALLLWRRRQSRI